MSIAVAPHFTHRDYFWTEWKTIHASKGFMHQYHEDDETYLIYGYDDPEVIKCLIYKGAVPDGMTGIYSQEQNDLDKADFLANWESTANKPITPIDSDGSVIIRRKTTKTGWHYEPRSLAFVTAKNDSLYNRRDNGGGMNDGTAYNDATIKFYDSNDSEITLANSGNDLPTFITNLANNCVKTVVDWHPTYDMDLIGGILLVKNAPTADAYIWVTVAPDIPVNLGGSVPMFAGGWNISFMGNYSQVDLNGRGVRTFVYDPVYKTNKFRMIVKHAAGVQIGMQFVFEAFRA